MQLSYFNHLKTIVESNRSENGYNPLLNESLLDVRQKNASNLSDTEFNKLLQYDPNLYSIQASSNELKNYPESYMRWLIMMNNKGELNNLTPNNVRDVLKKFDMAKKRRNLLPNNDINSYKSIETLENTVNNIAANLSVNQKNKDAKRNQKELQGEKKPGMYMNGAVELLFNGKDWEVWTPHTFEGSKALRRGASWCTGGDNCSFYDNYTKDGTLYVILSKNYPDEKYQLFVPSRGKSREREFRDAVNESLSFRSFCFQNPELQKFFMTQDDVNAAYPDLDDGSVDDEWNDDKEYEIMEEYHLYYGPDDKIYVGIDYDTLLIDGANITSENVQDVALNAYMGESEISPKMTEEFIQCPYFRDNVEWNNTDLYKLYLFFLKDSKTSKSNTSFDDFLSVLFQTDEKDYSQTKAYKWLASRSDDWKNDGLSDTIYGDILLKDLTSQWIADKLTSDGWKMSEIQNNNKDYIEQLQREFLAEPSGDDYYSVEDFFNDAIDRGNFSYEDYIHPYCFKEYDGDIDVYDADYDEYNASYADEDAHQIVSMFMSNDEYNHLDDEDDDLTQINDNLMVFKGEKVTNFDYQDARFAFNIKNTELNQIYETYKNNGKFDSLGFGLKIIHNMFYPSIDYTEIQHILGCIGLDTHIDLDKVKNTPNDLAIIEVKCEKFIDYLLKQYCDKRLSVEQYSNDDEEIDDKINDKINEVLRLAGISL